MAPTPKEIVEGAGMTIKFGLEDLTHATSKEAAGDARNAIMYAVEDLIDTIGRLQQERDSAFDILATADLEIEDLRNQVKALNLLKEKLQLSIEALEEERSGIETQRALREDTHD